MKIHYTIMFMLSIIFGLCISMHAGILDTIKTTAKSAKEKFDSLKKTAEDKGIDVKGLYNSARKKLEAGLGLSEDEEEVVSTVENAAEEEDVEPESLLEQAQYKAKNPRFLKYFK